MTRITVHIYRETMNGMGTSRVKSLKSDAPEEQQQYWKTWVGSGTIRWMEDVLLNYKHPADQPHDGNKVEVWRHMRGVWLDLEVEMDQQWRSDLDRSITKIWTHRIRVNNPAVGSNSWSVDAEPPFWYTVEGGGGVDAVLKITFHADLELSQDERREINEMTLPAKGAGRLEGRIRCPVSVGDPGRIPGRALSVTASAPKSFWTDRVNGRGTLRGAGARGGDLKGHFRGEQAVGKLRFGAIESRNGERVVPFTMENLPLGVPLRLEAAAKMDGWSALPPEEGNCTALPGLTACVYDILLTPRSGRADALVDLYADASPTVMLVAAGEWHARSLLNEIEVPRTVPGGKVPGGKGGGKGIVKGILDRYVDDRGQGIKDQVVLGRTLVAVAQVVKQPGKPVGKKVGKVAGKAVAKKAVKKVAAPKLKGGRGR